MRACAITLRTCFSSAFSFVRYRPLHADGLPMRANTYVLTLVLRSTHSSQLNVGLLRFCFFLGGPSPCVVLVVEAAGLVDGCGPPSSTVLVITACKLNHNVKKPRLDATQSRRMRRGSHARWWCKATGIICCAVVSRGPQKVSRDSDGFERGDCGEASPATAWHGTTFKTASFPLGQCTTLQ